MSTRSPVEASTDTGSSACVFQLDPDVEQELREAVAEIESGDFVEVTAEQLERCIVDGEWPWPSEYQG
jgi:hypothetical protein